MQELNKIEGTESSRMSTEAFSLFLQIRKDCIGLADSGVSKTELIIAIQQLKETWEEFKIILTEEGAV